MYLIKGNNYIFKKKLKICSKIELEQLLIPAIRKQCCEIFNISVLMRVKVTHIF